MYDSTNNENGLQQCRLVGIITEALPGMAGPVRQHAGPRADVRHMRERVS